MAEQEPGDNCMPPAGEVIALSDQQQEIPIEPQALRRDKRAPVVRTKSSERHQPGVAAFLGIWPGEESDEDFERMLEQVHKQRITIPPRDRHSPEGERYLSTGDERRSNPKIRF